MKQILVLSFFPAFTPPSNGGQSRLYHFYKSVSRWHKVMLLTSTHYGVTEERIDHGANFIERRIPKDHYFMDQWGLLDPYSSGGDLSGPAIAASSQFPTLLHFAYLEEYAHSDVIIHESPFTEAYDLFRGVDGKLRAYNAYNSETSLYKSLHPGVKSQRIHDLVRTSEKSLLEFADVVFYCNEGDLEAFRALAPNHEFAAHYVPNGTVLTNSCKQYSEPKKHKPHVVFMGSGHPPNEAAAQFIVQKLAPQCPDVCFQIVGSCLQKGRYPSNVKRLGLVSMEEKERLLQVADLALNPMAAGSGSNVKVLDYFSHSLPVLSTSFGMRGIHAEPGKDFVEASLDDFSEVLKRCLENSDHLRLIGEAGNRLASENYTWDRIAHAASDKINDLYQKKSLSQRRKFILVLNDYDSFAGYGGGCTRTTCLYTVVSESDPVVFLCFSANGMISARWISSNLRVIALPKSKRHEEELDKINSMHHVSCDDIVASQQCLNEQLLTLSYSLLRAHCKAIVLEHCYLVPLPMAYGDRFVYSSQNVELELKSHLLQSHPRRDELIHHVETIERQAVECAAAVIAVSDEDTHGLLNGKRTAGAIIVIRNGALEPPQSDQSAIELARASAQSNRQSVVFLGSAHMPNVLSATIILERIAPACPEVDFFLVGSVCNALHGGIPRNVHLHGVLDETSKCALMQSCSAAINPMASGGGSNVKLADYIANGLFVITTHFGLRGYPRSVADHVMAVEIADFPMAIKKVLSQPELTDVKASEARKELFSKELSMRSLSGGLVALLKDMERPKTRILLVSYRYTAPAMGGAESMIMHLIESLSLDGGFAVDVVTPEISHIENQWRFSERYRLNPNTLVVTNLPNVRFARFPLSEQQNDLVAEWLQSAWRAQPLFEREVSQQIELAYTESGLTWGWGCPETLGARTRRWAFASCGVFIAQQSRILIKGFAPSSAFVSVQDSQGVSLFSSIVEGEFLLEFDVRASTHLEFNTSIKHMDATEDPRPLAFIVSEIRVGADLIDLEVLTIMETTLHSLESAETFNVLHRASESSRSFLDVNLTDCRGPWSEGLESYIESHISEYDLVITHNNVFRPAVVAVEIAKSKKVPVILIPHSHLDDDFYHFPDLFRSVKSADLVLASPKAACSFFENHGCNVQYLPAGVDISEDFSNEDIVAFRKIWPASSPFVLVLGRKAVAKGYRHVISAVDSLVKSGAQLHVVLIGPDDDGLPVDSPNATYLGQQPRSIVRGALQSCLAVINMSSSESFGIVLLEAWLAGRPVIANSACAAFHDLAINEESALLVDKASLGEAILRLRDDHHLRIRLTQRGRETAMKYCWKAIGKAFICYCVEQASKKGQKR